MQKRKEEVLMEYNEFAGMFGSWAEEFKPFIEGKKFYDIYQRLKMDAVKEKIVPSNDATFRAFAKTPMGELKVVWYLMD